MTASKSSRARNARIAQAKARNGSGGVGVAVKDAGAARGSGTAKTAGPAKGADAAKKGAVAVVPPRAAQVRAEVAEDDLAESGTGPALWLQIATFVLALAGLGVSTYLTIAHFTQSVLLGCAETKGLVDCSKVTTSPQSYVFGIPVAVLGLAFYVFVAAIMSPWAWKMARREVHLLRIAAMVAGIGFVVYLVYAELFIIGNICLYCTSVHVITFLLFALTMFSAAAWGLRPARSSSAS